MLEYIYFIKHAFHLAAGNSRSVAMNFLGFLHPRGAATAENSHILGPSLMALGSQCNPRKPWQKVSSCQAHLLRRGEMGHGHKPEVLMVFLQQYGPPAIKRLWPKEAGFSLAFIIPSVGSKFPSLLSSDMSWKQLTSGAQTPVGQEWCGGNCLSRSPLINTKKGREFHLSLHAYGTWEDLSQDEVLSGII